MLTIPFTVYLIGLALVLLRVFRRAGEGQGTSTGRLALKHGLAWTGIWVLLFLLYFLVLGLGSVGM